MPEEDRNKDIELRSEKVRNIVGEIPPRVLRIGISIISVVVFLVLLLAYTIPYPEYKSMPISLYTIPSVQMELAGSSGMFFSDLGGKDVKEEQEICSLKLETDSVVYYYSTIDGALFCNYQNGDYVREGDVMLAIVPDSVTSVYGICLIPVDEMRDIKEGQQVVVVTTRHQSFAGYISKIHPIPERGQSDRKTFYKVKVFFTGDIGGGEKDILLPNSENTCKILISDEPILKRILKI